MPIYTSTTNSRQAEQSSKPERVNDDDDYVTEYSRASSTQSFDEEHERELPEIEDTEPDTTANPYDEVPVDHPDFDDDAFEQKAFKAPKNSVVRMRSVFITLFQDNWQPNFAVWPAVKFAVYTKEIAPTTGRIHYHAYVEFNEGKDLDLIKRKLDIPTANIQLRSGTQKQAIQYCTKSRTRFPGFTPVFYGAANQQGFRSDFECYAKAIEENATVSELVRASNGSALKFIGCLKKYQAVCQGYDPIENAVIARRMQASAQGIPYHQTTSLSYKQLTAEDRHQENVSNYYEFINGQAKASASTQAQTILSILADPTNFQKAKKELKKDELQQRKLTAKALKSVPESKASSKASAATQSVSGESYVSAGARRQFLKLITAKGPGKKYHDEAKPYIIHELQNYLEWFQARIRGEPSSEAEASSIINRFEDGLLDVLIQAIDNVSGDPAQNHKVMSLIVKEPEYIDIRREFHTLYPGDELRKKFCFPDLSKY